MRRLLVAGSSLMLVAVLGITLVGPANSASIRPDLAVSDLAEPPQAVAAGSSFRQTFTVANQGNRAARQRTSTHFFLDRNPNNTAGRRRVGRHSSGVIPGHGEDNKRRRLSVPADLATDDWFLVACADFAKRLREAREANNCRVAAQPVAINGSLQGPAGTPGENDETVLPRTVLPIGRATFDSGIGPGDDEKSDQRTTLANIGGVQLVADCKRTTNGDDGEADDPPVDDSNSDEDGDEAKILVYTDSGTVTFTSLGESSRRNIPPGEGEAGDPTDNNDQASDTNGGEGTHQAIAASRDPSETAPENDWAFAYRVGSIYINHSNGTELVFTGYAGIDVLGVGDNCVFSGVIKRVKVVG
jgi:CARDB